MLKEREVHQRAGALGAPSSLRTSGRKGLRRLIRLVDWNLDPMVAEMPGRP